MKDIAPDSYDLCEVLRKSSHRSSWVALTVLTENSQVAATPSTLNVNVLSLWQTMASATGTNDVNDRIQLSA